MDNLRENFLIILRSRLLHLETMNRYGRHCICVTRCTAWNISLRSLTLNNWNVTNMMAAQRMPC